MTAIILLLAVFVAGQFALAFLLWLGAGWANVAERSYWKCLLATLLLSAAEFAIAYAVPTLPPGLDRHAYALAVVSLLAGAVVSGFIVSAVLRTSFRRAILAWLPTLVWIPIGFVGVFYIVRPFVAEAFVVPTNAMAPTLLGPHRLGTCSACAGALVLPHDPDRPFEDAAELGICQDCLQIESGSPTTAAVGEPDRFICEKLLTPRRWDLVVFRSPNDPDIKLVKRLVGLPGEQVVIKEGAVWIDGERQRPPDDIAGLQFTAEFDAPFGVPLGSPDRPAQLGKDEYFVIGDNSRRSSDSRDWGPLPEENIEGVATLIYWPVSRWRVLR
jgi:signal peptidase I